MREDELLSRYISKLKVCEAECCQSSLLSLSNCPGRVGDAAVSSICRCPVFLTGLERRSLSVDEVVKAPFLARSSCALML